RSSAPTEVLAIEARLMRDVVARDQVNVMATIAELSPMLGRQFGDPAVVRNQFTMTISYFGQPSDWEMVHEVKVGSSVITRYYVVR
ncbi:hypothetical protein, partial [Lactococcus petauri]|uniref:hypothetical protein n=1 Tax=Lactococcus petauri TaxID=1940789 RepID=UPI0021F1D987